MLVYDVDFIGMETVRAIDEFRKNGGKVFVLRSLPKLLGTIDNPQYPWDSATLTVENEAFFNALPEIVKLTGEHASDIFVHCRKLADGTVRKFLFNRSSGTRFKGSVDGEDCELAPGDGIFAGEFVPTTKMVVTDNVPLPLEALIFPENHLLLAMWRKAGQEGGGLLNLLERNFPVFEKAGDSFETEFLWEGDAAESLELIWSETAFHDIFEIRFNGKVIDSPRRKKLRDCKDWAVDILPLLREGAYPTRNILTVTALRDGVTLPDAPLLAGRFQAAFPHCGIAQAHLSRSDGRIDCPRYGSWGDFGYGTFSGIAHYCFEFEVERTRESEIEWNGLFDSAEIVLDNQILGCIWQEDGTFSLGMIAAGKHSLELRVANSPANRDRAGHLRSGILGGVRLLAETIQRSLS